MVNIEKKRRNLLYRNNAMYYTNSYIKSTSISLDYVRLHTGFFFAFGMRTNDLLRS